MFSPHDTNAIQRNAHDYVDRLHHEARIESSLAPRQTSYRIRIASVVRRIATWIEPPRADVRISALHRPNYGSD